MYLIKEKKSIKTWFTRRNLLEKKIKCNNITKQYEQWLTMMMLQKKT